MATNYLLTGVILAISCLIIIPVGGALPISTIRPGNTIFIGEQGLDITAALDGDTILGWYASGATLGSSSPDYTITVSNPTSFSVNPGDYSSHTGNWYHMSSLSTPNGTAFSVADPSINLNIDDTSVNVDVTNKWVPTGDDLQFRIDSNLIQITQRVGVTSVPVTIKVQSPDGALFTSLMNNAGTVTSISPYQLTTTPQSTGPIWGTNHRDLYPPGNYLVWVECNVNSMKDNYGLTGKTISSQVSLLDQDKNPLMSDKNYVTNPTTAVSTIPTPQKTITVPQTTPTKVVTTTSLPTIVTHETTISQQPDTTMLPTTTPSATRTKSPGFESICSLVAIVIGTLFIFRKS